MQHGVDKDMQHGVDMDMQHGHGHKHVTCSWIWTSGVDVNMQI
jgi:hypothetical protein